MFVTRSIRFIKFLRFFGLCPFYWMPSTNIAVKIIVITYSVLFHGFLFYVILCMSLETLKELITSAFNFDTFVYIAKDVNTLGGYLIVPLLYWRWSSELSKYFSTWMEFQKEISKMPSEKLLDENRKRRVKSVSIISIVLLFFGSALLATYFESSNVYSYGLVIMYSFVSYLWNETCNMILDAIMHLTLHVQSSQWKIKVFDFHTEKLISTWISLCELVKSSCRLYSNLLFSSIQSMTLLIIFNVYALFTQVVQKKLDIHDYFQSIVILTLAASNIYAICDKSHNTEKQIKSMIHDEILWTGIFLSDTEKLIKIKKMLYVIKMTTPSISLFNYINVDRPLMMNLLSVVVTYLVVLIQFQVSGSLWNSDSSNASVTNSSFLEAVNLSRIIKPNSSDVYLH